MPTRDAGSRAEARQLVVERYDWSAVARDFEDALRDAAVPTARSGSERASA